MRIPGRSVRWGCFQLMPSSSMDSCAGVRWILPSRVTGQTKRPRSSLLVNMHRPSRSAHSTFIMSPRRPRKMNRCPLNGSSRNVFCTLEARPLKPLRMSVMPATSQMREPAGSDITANSLHFPDKHLKQLWRPLSAVTKRAGGQDQLTGGAIVALNGRWMRLSGA